MIEAERNNAETHNDVHHMQVFDRTVFFDDAISF